MFAVLFVGLVACNDAPAPASSQPSGTASSAVLAIDSARAPLSAASSEATVPPSLQASAAKPAIAPNRVGEAPPVALAASSSSAALPLAASAAPTVAASAIPPAAPPEPALQVEGEKVAEAQYQLYLRGPKKVKVGQAAQAEVVLAAKATYHCNPSYPYKLKLGAPAAGVSYPDPIARAASVSPERTTLAVPFTPSAKGPARIAGMFYFSVCNDSQCHIDNRSVALDVEVE